MWALKIVAKIILARLPFNYDFWKYVGLFRHGRMDSNMYSSKVFNLHTSRAYPSGIPKGLTILELGPGDSVVSCVFAACFSVKKTYLVDVGDFAKKDVEFYRKIAKDLELSGYTVPNFTQANSIEDILKLCNAEYVKNGLLSLRAIPSDSVDFIWSHSVLEHVRKDDLEATLFELKRILKPTGISSHSIDFQDHLSKSLNSLRFSNNLWESNLFVKSGFYTNRIPAKSLHILFKEVGFNIIREEFGYWNELPIKRKYIHSDFSKFSDDELSACTSYILLNNVEL